MLHAASARHAVHATATTPRCLGPRCAAALNPATVAAAAASVAAGEAGVRTALIVGGGAAGLSCALEFAERGWSVSVLSRDASEGATLAAGGMLAPQAERLEEGPLLDLCLRSRAHFGPWLRRLEALSGVDVGLCSRGGFIAPAFERDAVVKWTPPRSAGPAVWLGPDAVRDLEPSLSAEAVGGWWYEREASVDPRALHHALREACGKLGVRIVDGVSAASLSLSDSSGHGSPAATVLTSDGVELGATAVVLACGAWARELLPLASFPIKGQARSTLVIIMLNCL